MSNDGYRLLDVRVTLYGQLKIIVDARTVAGLTTPLGPEVAQELRRLARAMEARDAPFAKWRVIDVDEARGAAEREIDALALHIQRLQQRAVALDPLADLVVTVGCEAVHPKHELGRQHVAKPCTGVRIRHVPTGLEVMVDSERSQHANRAQAARQMLASLSGRKDEGIVPHDVVIAQLSAWAEGRRP